jgi:hypothetical protein
MRVVSLIFGDLLIRKVDPSPLLAPGQSCLNPKPVPTVRPVGRFDQESFATHSRFPPGRGRSWNCVRFPVYDGTVPFHEEIDRTATVSLVQDLYLFEVVSARFRLARRKVIGNRRTAGECSKSTDTC